MKKTLLILSFLVCVSGVAVAQYSIDWSTIDGGGGTGMGGVYSVSGNIGQPDAGVMSNNVYSVTGGYWSVLNVVQTPGAPMLRIALTATNSVALSWPSPATAFVLQHNSDLATTNWTSVIQSPVDDGTNKVVTLSNPTGNRFFRLTKP